MEKRRAAAQITCFSPRDLGDGPLKDWLWRHRREEFERRWRPLAQMQDGFPKVLLNNTLRFSSQLLLSKNNTLRVDHNV